jgi:phosphoglycerol geranylgeranyltransferase
VRKLYDGILIVGGGLKSPDMAKEAALAGAEIIVIGTLLDEPRFEGKLRDICRAISHS